ncbi:chemotaxis response regulator protein-glutamate methylesterase [Pelagicoccus sp. SDUM812003]|uniref:protein-glutamate methylesterase/protein-glutamine glutaminase n=1 Tax=Pelagicoccus sp. SDUM812003 TaxID=3041267 RepID=UPI00280F9ACB|nr:chemotaxis response regulator protein-glutamate methylesterase [Pelagicoccus sp. SDUM812003]MDQ8204336.1 chemotaxis response regulator protein-glutamate methylesterase [Pelagicoccus sp. SDUM812003]
MAKHKVLIADDSALMRRTLRKIIEADDELELVAYARDGADAVAKAKELQPDVISLDINMPVMDGVTALQHILELEICPVVMVSSLTQRGAATTFECMELGAFDFVAKPGGTVSSDMSAVQQELVKKLKFAARGRHSNRLATRRRRARLDAVQLPSTASLRSASGRFRAIAIGISTGGPGTIMDVLPRIPAETNGAVFLVQHMPANFIGSFVSRLDKACALTVVEAESGQKVEPGYCYVASGDKQMTFYRRASGAVYVRTPTTPKTLYTPSVDVMFDSCLSVYGADTIGVIMTGIGDDGAAALQRIRSAGGHTIAESEETAVVYGMPREAVARGAALEVLPCWDVAAAIQRAI